MENLMAYAHVSHHVALIPHAPSPNNLVLFNIQHKQWSSSKQLDINFGFIAIQCLIENKIFPFSIARQRTFKFIHHILTRS